MRHAQALHQSLAAHGLTGFRPANLQQVTPGGGVAEIVVEGDDPMHFGARHVQRLRHQGNHALVERAEGLLQSVQDGQHGAFQLRQPCDDLLRPLLIEGRGRSHSLTHRLDPDRFRDHSHGLVPILALIAPS